jgi:hypothetical protein
MFIYTFQIIFISLILIILIHYLYNFFKDTLTIPKTKDLVNSSQYQEIIDIIKNTNNNQNTNLTTSTPIDSLKNTHVNINKDEMKDELKNFLKKINTETNINSNQSPLESNPFSSNTYSSYM